MCVCVCGSAVCVCVLAADPESSVSSEPQILRRFYSSRKKKMKRSVSIIFMWHALYLYVSYHRIHNTFQGFLMVQQSCIECTLGFGGGGGGEGARCGTFKLSIWSSIL
jgi:hypothetical protein